MEGAAWSVETRGEQEHGTLCLSKANMSTQGLCKFNFVLLLFLHGERGDDKWSFQAAHSVDTGTWERSHGCSEPRVHHLISNCRQ